MAKTAHPFLMAAALAVAVMLLMPATGTAYPADMRGMPRRVFTYPADIGPSTAASPGAVKWRLQVSGQYVVSRPAVGPDGGVVVASSSGNVYSLTADGALRWALPSLGSYGGPSIGADGTT